MNRYKNKYLVIFMIILCISIGFAYISSNLSILGHGIFAKNTWDIYFDNLVYDYNKTEISTQANIENRTTINFSVSLEEPGSEYYFYSDIVNNGTIDAMLDTFEVTGLEEVESFLTAKVTYADEIEINKYDLLKADSKDRIKVHVKYRDDINPEDLPTAAGNINLSVSLNYLQADENAKERVHNADVTPPEVKFLLNNEDKGKNNWYKNLFITTKLNDSSSIKSVKYCVTTDEECTPNTTTEITNNTFTYKLLNNASVQTICVEATDEEENIATTCSTEEYKVDGEDPTITSVSVTPDDDTMTIEIVGNDTSSGIALYYYSKDGGSTYVKSSNPNYTFTNLENGDYIVVVYVEDRAGNTSLATTETTTVRGKSWCKENGITNLSDCVIATEAKNSNVETAKSIIETKATPDFSQTTPTYTYSAKIDSNITTITSADKKIYYSSSYTISNDKANFGLINSNYKMLSEINLETNTDYYLCNTITSNWGCSSLYKIKNIEYDSNNNNYIIYKNDIKAEMKNYDASGSGMYVADDDLGKSYYYRGITGGNFVKFADKYWRIMRINGDGSIRLMYFSDEGTTQGKSAITSQINSNNYDPTYFGLMHNDKGFSTSEITSATIRNSIYSQAIYFYGKSYEYNSEKNLFTLKDTGEEGNIISGKWSDIYQKVLPQTIDGEANYYYSCFGTSANSSCQVLKKIISYQGSGNLEMQYISHSSTSYENATKNVSKSDLLNSLEKWYEANILNQRDATGNLYSDYLENSIFCNDRSLSPTTTGDGFSLNSNTSYGADYRIENNLPSYECPNLARDGFTLETSSIGNKLLKYPVGTLTADEVVFAGGVYNKVNKLYYMNYNDIFWTLSPAYFSISTPYGIAWKIIANGEVRKNFPINARDGIKPVISLKADTLIASGDGTKENPYTVALPNN